MTDALLTLIVSASSAVIGVVTGATVSLKIAKRQFHTAVIATSRQQWINSLRDCLAEFISACTVYALHDTIIDLDMPAQTRQLERATFLRSKLRLLLNPTEKDHQELGTLIESTMTEAIKSRSAEKSNFGQLQVQLTAKAQTILKREWEVTKGGR